MLFKENKISIIIPTYNSVQFIHDSIKSIINQTFYNWELIITDDCSTDNTYHLIKQYSKNDPRIKIYRLKSNSGAGIARNNSIKYAKGRFIAFCDSDDQWKPEKLEKQVQFMLENNLALSYTSYEIIDEKGKKLGLVNAPEKVNYKIMLRNNYIGCLTAMYDTKKIGKVYMPEIRKRQDWALWLKILKMTEFAMSLNEPLSIYRDRSNSISSNKIKMLRYTWKIYHEVEQFSKFKSLYLISQFLYYYFQKKKNAK